MTDDQQPKPVEFAADSSPEVVETTAGESAESFEEAIASVGEGSMLGYRLAQQALLSDFGLGALGCSDIDALLGDAVRCAAKGLRTRLAKILEYRPAEKDLLIRAGVGWKSGVVGVATIGADAASPAGFAFHTGAPVISNHLGQEERFRTPAVMAQHGVRRAINVLIARRDGPWGVLEVDSSSAGEFEAADLAFLQGLANLVGVAFDRIVTEQELRAVLDQKEILIKEASHRVKNSLALLSGLLRMQARGAQAKETTAALDDASDRILAVAATHDLLWRQNQSETMDLADLLPALCEQLNAQTDSVTVHCRIDHAVVGSSEGISLALLVTEAVTNAFKYAFAEGQGGTVTISLEADGDRATLRVADDGRGLPEGFDARGSKSLGMRLINTLGNSVGSGVTLRNGDVGSLVEVEGIALAG